MTTETLTFRWKVFDPRGVECGGFECGPQGVVLFKDSIPALGHLLAQATTEGLSGRKDVYIEDSQKWVLCSVPLNPAEQAFGFAFAEHVNRSGFRAEQEHPEVLESFRRFLSDIPEQERGEFIEKFQALSYLQKTAVLEELSEQERNQR